MIRNIAIFVAIVISTQLSSQSSIGLLYGGTQYRGDLSDDEVGLFNNLRSTKGITYQYTWNNKYAFYTSFLSTYMMAYDKDLNDPALIQRNLHFKSPLKELSMGFEIHFLGFFTEKNYRVSPYYKTGVSMFYFNPQGEYNGRWHDLQAMRTEGQGLPNSGKKPYSLFNVSYPFGLGIKVRVNPKFNFRIEICPRKTNTDYLDDVSGEYYDLDQIRKYSSIEAAKLSYQAEDWDINNEAPVIMGKQRGNFALKDWYIVHQISVSYTFEKPKIEEIKPPEVTPLPLQGN